MCGGDVRVAASAGVRAGCDRAEQSPRRLCRAASPTPSTSQEPQKASGIVPPGVKLVRRNARRRRAASFRISQSGHEDSAERLARFCGHRSREPAVAARLVILSAGSIKDPAGMPGVAEMTANLLTQGTEKRSAKDIAEAIDFVGGSLEAKAGRDATTVTLDVVKKDLGVGMDLMSDVVLHPAFRAEELDRQRQQLLSDLQVQYSDPDYLATLVFRAHVYGASPYGFRRTGHARYGEKTAARRFREISRRELRAESSRCSLSRETSRRKKPSPPPKNISAPGRKCDVAASRTADAFAPPRPAHLADR